MLPCIPHCPYIYNSNICANARHDAIKISFILFDVDKYFMFGSFFIIYLVELNSKVC